MTRIREADSLDQSVKNKFKTGATTNEIPEPPPKLKPKVHYDGITLQVDVPPTGFNAGFAIAIILIRLFEAFLISVFAILCSAISTAILQELFSFQYSPFFSQYPYIHPRHPNRELLFRQAIRNDQQSVVSGYPRMALQENGQYSRTGIKGVVYLEEETQRLVIQHGIETRDYSHIRFQADFLQQRPQQERVQLPARIGKRDYRFLISVPPIVTIHLRSPDEPPINPRS